MILRRLPGADDFTVLTFTQESCSAQRIPCAGYPIKLQTFEAALETGRELFVEDLIRGLMEWLDVTEDAEPATDTLLRLLQLHYPPDGRTAATCEFADENDVRRRFCIGEVDLESGLIALQRDQRVMALVQPSSVEPGRMVLTAPRPISAQVAEMIIGHSLVTYMLEPHDAYASARQGAGRNANFYAIEAGATAIIPWDYGFGRSEQQDSSGEDDTQSFLPQRCDWLAPNQLAMMIAIGAGYG